MAATVSVALDRDVDAEGPAWGTLWGIGVGVFVTLLWQWLRGLG